MISYKSYHNSYYFSLIFHKMSDIKKLFQRGTKNRDLSDKSKTGEDPNKVKEVSLDCSHISQILTFWMIILPKV